MTYDIISKSSDKRFKCNNRAWPKYLAVGTAFGWVPAGAVFSIEFWGGGSEPIISEHPSRSYFGSDWQQVTDDDALAFGAALELAIAAINAESPMTDSQEAALKEFEVTSDDPYTELPPKVHAFIIEFIERSRAEHPTIVRTIQTQRGSFDVDIHGIMDLADVVSAGRFFIA
jgi:hypothetical protein